MRKPVPSDQRVVPLNKAVMKCAPHTRVEFVMFTGSNSCPFNASTHSTRFFHQTGIRETFKFRKTAKIVAPRYHRFPIFGNKHHFEKKN